MLFSFLFAFLLGFGLLVGGGAKSRLNGAFRS